MGWSWIFLQLYILPQLGKMFRFTAFILLEAPFIVETIFLLPIALLLELACLWIANMFLLNFRCVIVSGQFFFEVRSFLFLIFFFLSKQHSSLVLLVLHVPTILYMECLTPFSTIYFSAQFFITFSHKLSHNCVIYFFRLRMCISHILTRNI